MHFALVEEGFLHMDGDGQRRSLTVGDHRFEQLCITYDLGVTTNAECLALPGD